MSDNRISWKAISLVVILFVLGIALGAGGEHLWNAHALKDQRRPHIVQQLKDQLGLTADQEKKFDTIIADDSSKFHDIDTQMHTEWDSKYHSLDTQRHAEWDPKRDQVRQQGRDQIRAILTPEQRAKFDAFVQKLDEERRKPQPQQQH